MADSRFLNIGGILQRAGERALSSMPIIGPAAAIAIPAARALRFNTDGKPLAGTTSQAPNSPLPQESAAPAPVAPLADSPTSYDDPGPSFTSAPADAPASGGMDEFNLLMTDMLKGAQGLNTADFLARKRALERTSLGRTSEVTPEDLRTLSPDQQAAIRSGKTSALRPEIDANAYELEKAEQAVDNFFRVHEEARKLGQEFADKMVAPDSVIENARKIIEANPDALSTVLAGFNDKSKEKIIGGLDYSKLKSSSADTGKLVKIGGVDYVQNADGSFTVPEVPAPGSLPMSPEQEAKRADVLALIDVLQDPNTAGKHSAVGASFAKLVPFAQEAGLQGNRSAFEAKIATLKSTLTLDNLSLLKGPMSDKDIAFLMSVGSSLDPRMSEAEFDAELQRIEDTLRKAGTGGGAERKTINDPETGQPIEVEKASDGRWYPVGEKTSMNLPQRNNNPGNVKSSPVTDRYAMTDGNGRPMKDPQGHLIFANAENGKLALRADIEAKITGNSAHLGANPTIEEIGSVYAEDPTWGKKVAGILGVSPTTRASALNREQLINAIMRQEGAFA